MSKWAIIFNFSIVCPNLEVTLNSINDSNRAYSIQIKNHWVLAASFSFYTFMVITNSTHFVISCPQKQAQLFLTLYHANAWPYFDNSMVIFRRLVFRKWVYTIWKSLWIKALWLWLKKTVNLTNFLVKHWLLILKWETWLLRLQANFWISAFVCGGCAGSFARNPRMIFEEFPYMKCTVFDLPHVVANLPENNNLNFVGGDMFPSSRHLSIWGILCLLTQRILFILIDVDYFLCLCIKDIMLCSSFSNVW